MEFCFTERRDCFLPQTDTICKPCAVDLLADFNR